MLALSGLKRPLPPPESRQTVMSQIETANNWVTLDSQEDLQICMPPKRVKLSSDDTLQPDVDPVRTADVTTDSKQNGATTFFTPYTSDEVRAKNQEVVLKKKSLFGSIANMFGINQTNTREQPSHIQVVEDSKPQKVVNHVQSWSFEHIEKDKAASPLPENDQEEALRLARIANNNTSYLNDQGAALSTQQNKQSNRQPDRNEIARKRLENISHERSRQLREQALARRLSTTSKSELGSKSGPDQIHAGFKDSVRLTYGEHAPQKPQVTTNLHEPTKKRLEIVPRSNYTSPAEIDRLFDIAVEAADDKQMFGSGNATISSKPTKSLDVVHPASRAAAEQYRSQYRDSAKQCAESLATSTTSRDFVEREKRLRTLTSQHATTQEITLPTTPNSTSNNMKDALPPIIRSAPRKPLTNPAIHRLSSLLCSYDYDDSDDGGDDARHESSAVVPKSPTQNSSPDHGSGSVKDLSPDKLAPARLSSPKTIPATSASIGATKTSTLPKKLLPAVASPTEVALQKLPQSTLQTPPASQEELWPDPPETVTTMPMKRPQTQSSAVDSISRRGCTSHSLWQAHTTHSLPTPRPAIVQSVTSSEENLPGTKTFKYPPLRSIPVPLKPAAESSKPGPKTTAVFEEFVNYPEKPDLVFPKNFESHSEENQAVHIECELLKERERDLEFIIPTFEQIAYLGTLDQFTDRERQEIRTVHEYVKAVVDDGLSGKRMRKRVQDIRQNMKRRVMKHAPETEPDYSALLNTTLKAERQDHIKQLLEDTRKRLDSVRIVRLQFKSKRHTLSRNSRTRSDRNNGKVKHDTTAAVIKRIQFVPNAPGSSSDQFDNLPDGAEVILPSLTTTEKKRQAQYAAADRREAHLRARLALYDSTTAKQVEPAEAPLSFDDGLAEDSSDTSEEEEGAEHFSGFVPVQTQKESIQSIEEAYKKNDGTVSRPVESIIEPSKNDTPVESAATRPQEKHESLAATLQQKRAQQAISMQQQAQKIDPVLLNRNKNRSFATDVEDEDGEIETEVGQEFDDVDDDSNSSEEVHTCFRYIVKAQYAGFDAFEAGYEYVHRQYLNSAAARSAVDAEIDSLKKTYLESLMPRELPKIKEEYKQEGAECSRLIELGPDAQSSCRLWIEREEYEPSHDAYHNALVKQACHAKSIYTVRWERTITPAALARHGTMDAEDQENASNQVQQSNPPKQDSILDIDAIDSDDDDLFGPESPLPPPSIKASSPPPLSSSSTNTLQISTEMIAFDAQRYFTSIAQANRHAKDVFMRWYIDHLQGASNHGYIRQADYAIEEQLASYGDFTMWERQNEFKVYVHDDEDGSEDGAERTMTFTHDDKMRVWVVRIDVQGPAN